jgi:hypothetical protein
MEFHSFSSNSNHLFEPPVFWWKAGRTMMNKCIEVESRDISKLVTGEGQAFFFLMSIVI